MALSEARKKANKTYQEKLDQLTIRPPKGTKARWTAAAAAQGKSLQRFIIDTVDAAVESTNAKKPEA